MRIAELSEASGVPRATVKYYLREGLLQPGTALGPTQAEYDERHLARLRLIRALVEVGGLSLAAVRGVVRAAEDPALAPHEAFGVAYAAIGEGAAGGAEPPADDARARVDAWLDDHGWDVDPGAPARAALAAALRVTDAYGYPDALLVADGFAQALAPVAAREVAFIEPGSARDEMVERVVVGTLVYERALAATRRLLLEHLSASRFADG